MAEGFKIAEAFVEVKPDTEGFREKLQAALDEAVDGVHADVTAGISTEQIDEDADKIREKVDELDGLHAEPSVGLDALDADASIEDIKARLGELRDEVWQAQITADDDDAEFALAKLTVQLTNLSETVADPKITAEGTADAVDRLNRLQAQFMELSGVEATPRVTAQTDEATTRIGAVKSELDDLEQPRVVPVDAETSEAQAKIAELEAEIEQLKTNASSPTQFNLSGLQGGSGLAAGGMGVGALMPGISSAVAGMGMLGATAGLAFGNIGAAVMAHSQAVKQAAANQMQYADQVASSEMSLTETVRNAAMSQAQAIESVTMAQQQQQMATAGLSEAQFNLQEAWIQARYALQQLNDAMHNSATTIKAAELAVAQAKYQQLLVDQNAMSTSLDRAQAAISVTQAEEQLTSARQNAIYVAKQAHLQDKRGVSGSQQVVMAEQALKQAIYAVKDARWSSMMAQKELVNTELNNANQVKQAQMAVAQAQLQATGGMNNFYADMARLSGPGREIVRVLLAMHPAIRALEHIAQNAIAPGVLAFFRGIRSLMPEFDRGVRAMGHAMSLAFGQFGRMMATPAFRNGLMGLIRNGVRFAEVVLPPFARFLQMMGEAGGKAGAFAGIAAVLAGLAKGLTGFVQGLIPAIPAINQIFMVLGQILAQVGPQLAQIIGLAARTLMPLMRYLNEHPHGTIVKVLADIVAGMIAFRGLQKVVISPLAKFAEVAVGLKGKFGSVVDHISGLFGKLGGVFSGLGGKLASMWSSASSATVSFVSGLASNLSQAASATVGWIAEHAVATGEFIAQNIAQAASATAAFIAENAATLGIGLAITALIGVVVWAGLHWHRVWGDIKSIALDIWHNVLDPMWHGIEAGVRYLVNNVFVPQFDLIKATFTGLEDAALWLWHNVLDPVWQGIQTGVADFVSAFQSAWDKLTQVFSTPVNFLVKTVYDDGIRRLWNDVVGAVGLGSMKLPFVAPVGLASGGVVPGFKPGHDSVPAMLSPGEGVLNPNAVKAIGPGTVNALNKQFPSSSSGSKSGGGSKPAHTSSSSSSSSSHHSTAMKEARKQAVRHSRKAATGAVGLAHGGLIGDIGNWFTSIGSGILHSAGFMAEMASNPVRAIQGLLGHVVKTPAAGPLGRVMDAIPSMLIRDLAQFVGLGAGGKGGGAAVSSPVTPTGAVAAWFSRAMKVTRAPKSWLPDLETIAWYESSDRPDAINLTDSNAKAGDPSRGLMQLIMTTFQEYHQAGTSPDIYDPVANIAAGINYIRARYGNPGLTPGIIALAHGQKYQGYDSGGWAMPGVTGLVNKTGKPEAVLTPEQSRAFLDIVGRLGQGGGAAGEPQVVMNYYGTQRPTVEQQSIMMRDLALAIGGVA